LVQVLWEGVGKTAFLRKGMATVRLTAVHDCTTSEGCLYGNRNIDLVMLHPNVSDIQMRMVKENRILPFDGLLSQHNEVFMQITNHDPHNNITVVVPISYMHSPYAPGNPHLILNRSTGVGGSFEIALGGEATYIETRGR
jgi:hypothetical protein